MQLGRLDSLNQPRPDLFIAPSPTASGTRFHFASSYDLFHYHFTHLILLLRSGLFAHRFCLDALD